MTRVEVSGEMCPHCRAMPGEEHDLGCLHRMKAAEHPRHIVFEVEVPVLYTGDLEDFREFQDETQMNESEWLLNCLGEPGVCRLRTEVSGEKASEVIEIWGSIRSAKLVEPSPGYGDKPHLTDAQLQQHGGFKLTRDEDACEWCQFYESDEAAA